MTVSKNYPLGAQLIASVLDRKDLYDVIKQGDVTDKLSEHEVDGWEYLRSFIAKHGETPSREAFARHCDMALPKEAPEPPGYYVEQLEARHIDRTLKQGVQDANEFMRPGKRDPKAALEVLRQTVSGLLLGSNAKKIRDFRDLGVELMVAHNAVKLGTDRGVALGWPTLDRQMRGVKPGDLLSIVARPGAGKTWMLASRANYAWSQGKRVLLATIEMPGLEIAQRLGAMHAHVSHDSLRLGAMTTRQTKRFKGAMLEAKNREAPMWIVDGSMATTVDDLIMLRHQLNPDFILVDGAYLLSHPDPRINVNNTRKVHLVCDSLKNELAMGTEVAVAASWQLNREAVKKQKANGGEGSPGMEDIADSDAISRNSSVILALLEQETAGSIDSKLIEILKGRQGERGRFRINCDFEMMHFDEVEQDYTQSFSNT